MTFERGFCPTCGVIDGKVVKSPPMPPPVPGWGEVGPNFDRCIIFAAAQSTICLRGLYFMERGIPYSLLVQEGVESHG